MNRRKAARLWSAPPGWSDDGAVDRRGAVEQAARLFVPELPWLEAVTARAAGLSLLLTD
jgi:hypothetical protein